MAYLDRSVFIGEQVTAIPRMQSLFLPQDTKVIAVVRIEAPASRAHLDLPQLDKRVAAQVIAAARKPRVAALQIDFDAAQSQRAFYRRLIEETRRRMPAGMPLSITALASWCGKGNWMEGLPVDEVVPMLFRMGRDFPRDRRPGWSYLPGSQSCRDSVGLSTDEVWPRLDLGQRVYVFHPRAWNPVALKNLEKLVEP